MKRLVIAIIVVTACAEAPPTTLPVVPRPVRTTWGHGSFPTSDQIRIGIRQDDPSLIRIARLFGEWTGTTVDIVVGDSGTIRLGIDETVTHAEGYRLNILADQISVTGASSRGVFYGLQTLRQLWTSGDGMIAAAEIVDEPRFPYRGMMLDVGRHTYSVEFVKRFIDLIALHKMNTFHWHLTEDQGWRIEIERYPRLTEVGAYRRETMVEKNFDPYVGDGVRYGGFFTQDEIRDVVAYAADRFVTVIPEIEMPGHSTAALAAYPELACTDGPFEVSTIWGVKQDIYCPHEATFVFLQNVLLEVMALFPSRYIHIGGDEAPKTRWENSEAAQNVIAREGLADEHELQSYFIRRIEQFLLQHDRRLIGWDEILEGGLAPEATVMSWRGMDGGIEAAQQGHDVIMTPTSHVYLDYYQGNPEFEPLAIGGFLPLERVYALDPVPDVLTATEAEHILGVQGNVWTEYIKTAEHVEYMAFPRAAAIAEVGWSPASHRNYDDFLNRLGPFLGVLDRMDVNYRVPEVQGLEEDIHTLDDDRELQLNALLPGTIRYTLDGTDPTSTSTPFDGAVVIPATEDGTTVTARLFTESGRASPPARARVIKTTLREPSHLTPRNGGILSSYFADADMSTVNELFLLEPTLVATRYDIALPEELADEKFGMAFDGFVDVPEDGIYRFALTSDDGSTLALNGDVLIDNDGFHAARTVVQSIGLKAGWHRIEIKYFQGGGGKTLELDVTLNGLPIVLTFGHS